MEEEQQADLAGQPPSSKTRLGQARPSRAQLGDNPTTSGAEAEIRTGAGKGVQWP